jgi:hypothetical protein
MPRIRISSSARRTVVALLAACALAAPSAAQIRYATVFEGWHRNADGSFDMVFGYMNRNYEQEIDLPIGADNSLEPGVPDQGQPTHFYPRRQQFVFTVRVPKDFGKKDLIWTLKMGDKVEKAYASLLPFWELGDFVYQENRGSSAEIGIEPEPNEAPKITVSGAASLTARANEPVALTVKVTDDGHPAPRRRPNGAAPVRRDSDGAVITQTGTPGPGGAGPRRENPLTQAVVRLDPGVSLGVTWLIYRGPTDGVRFDPQRVGVTDGAAATKVTFAKPGVYLVRAYADDGVFTTPADIQITVR